jgi:hypothetical protein
MTILTNRASGRTSALVLQSADRKYPIICSSKQKAESLKYQAKIFNVEIPEPIIYSQLVEGRVLGKQYDGFLMDDAHEILQKMCGDKLKTIAI